MVQLADALQVPLPSDVSASIADTAVDALGECKFLIGTLGALEQLTTLGMSNEPVQLTAGELFGLFHGIKQQAERIEALLDQEED